jgi:APA family basic amino acid/polyamine antiporter
MTIIKLASLAGLIIFGLFHFDAEVWNNNWGNAWHLHNFGSTTELSLAAALGAIAAGMVGSIFSNDAWNSVTFIAGEMKNPKRNIGLSLFLGTLIITLVYLLTNIMYTGVLSLDQIANADKDRVGVEAAKVIFGNVGTIIIAITIMISTFGCVNGFVLAGPRVYYTMANDGLFFKSAGTLNSFAVPAWSIWVQCLIACLWCFSGKYGQLLDMISFVVVVFYMLTILGIFILRRKAPNIDRPYKAFGYPIIPAIYIIMATVFCILLIIYKPQFTWPGIIITLLGIPLYFIAIRSK